MRMLLFLVLFIPACSAPEIQERVAGAAELAAVALDVAAVEVQPDPCAVLTAGAVALRGAAAAARTRELPEVRLSLGRCGAVAPARVSCEVQAWAPAITTWLGGVSEVALRSAAEPTVDHVAPAVLVGRCP
jgi:hypothetical protein